jgi:hypothetical protein
MGICLAAQTLQDEKIATLHSQPPLVWRIVAPDDEEAYLMEIGEDKPPGFLARLFGSKRQWPPTVPSFDFGDAELHELDMDKSWDGVKFCLKPLLAGKAPDFFEDGRTIGHVEVGYGPAMSFTSDQVATMATAYGVITEKELLAQFMPSKMGDVYLDGLWQRDDNDAREYLTENFKALQEFLETAARHRLGVLVYYT